jgi:serine/threonine protein kinase
MNPLVRKADPFAGSTQRMLSSGLEDVLPDVVRSARGSEPATDGETGVPAKWDDYEIVQKIGHGGMGSVYLAWQAGLERFVALKFLHRELNAKPSFVERFRREAKMAASLQHPNIVRVHEVGEVDGRLYFAMDFIEGRDLAEVLKEGAMPWSQAARYCHAVARAMEYAHGRWVLHRDLKPSNVLIDLQDQPHVTDFGIAGKMETPSTLTETTHILGSPGYLSPEQASGSIDDVTAACDIHAIGVILYECLSGKPPFRGDTVQGTLTQVREKQPGALRACGTSIPRDLEVICLKCLDKEPKRRYGTAQALADDLERCLKGERILARRTTTMDHAARWLRHHPRAATLFAAMCGMMLGLLGVLAHEHSKLSQERRNLQATMVENRHRLADVYVQLGQKWQEDQQPERATECFQRARELAGDNPEIVTRIQEGLDKLAHK